MKDYRKIYEPFIIAEEYIQIDEAVQKYCFDEHLNEVGHIDSELYGVSFDITKQLIKFVNQYRYNQNSLIIGAYYFTQWSFASNEDRFFPNTKTIDDILPKFQQTYDESLYHPVYICTVDNKFMSVQTVSPDALAAAGGRCVDPISPSEKELSELIKAKLKNDKILIYCNIQAISCYELSRWEDEALVQSVIAHELQHTSDRFIVRHKDTIKSKVNSLYADFVSFCNKHSELKNSDIYDLCAQLAYRLSPIEQRAHLNQLSVFLQRFYNDYEGSRNYRYYVERIYNGLSPFSTFDGNLFPRRKMICSLLRTRQLTNITKLYTFNNIARSLVLDWDANEHIRIKFMLVLGFFMLRHNMLKIKDMTKKDRPKLLELKELNSLLTEENILDALQYKGILFKNSDELSKILLIVRQSVLNNYFSYEKKIYDEIDKWLERLFPNINFEQTSPTTKPINIFPNELQMVAEKFLT